MAQQQPRRDHFGNAPRAQDLRDRDRDRDRNVGKNEESWKEELGRGTANDPAANYAYGMPGGYGSTDDGASGGGGGGGFEYSSTTAGYGTTGTAPGFGADPTGFGNTGAGLGGGAGQWGREPNADRGESGGRNRNRGMGMGMNMGGRDHK